MNPTQQQSPRLPSGRGLYIWRLDKCERGNLSAILARCQRAGIRWVAVKAGNGGHRWSQFTKELVDAFHGAGIDVWGWSYDVPGCASDQAAVIQHVQACGADGFVTDSEIEWEHCRNPDDEAARYLQAIESAAPGFPRMDAPWPIIKGHPLFPFTAFSKGVSARCAQVYWVEIGGGVASVWKRFVESWAKYEALPGRVALPRYPSGSIYHKKNAQGAVAVRCTVNDVLWFERQAREAGCPGVLHWVWELVPPEIWAAWESGAIPRW